MILIEKNNKYYIEVDVVTIETTKPSQLLISTDLETEGKLMYAPFLGFDLFDENKNFCHKRKVNLFFLSNEDIRNGDFYLDRDRNTIHKSSFDKLPPFLKRRCKKIIACTDISYNKEILPRPHDSFISIYLSYYNNKKTIKKVLAEVNVEPEYSFGELTYRYESINTNIEPEYDSIIIEFINDNLNDSTYTINDLKEAFYAGREQRVLHENDSGVDYEFVNDFNEWINKKQK